MRDAFVRTLVQIFRKNPDVILITGDLGFGVLTPIEKEFPDRFINAGIAEQSMTGIAAGLALEGKTAVTYSIGNFNTLRCIEQIRNDCAYHNANVKIVSIGGGFAYGPMGMTHHATEDLAIMRSIPGTVVFAPADSIEAEAATTTMFDIPGVCYLRLGRGGEPKVHQSAIGNVRKALQLRQGKDVVIFSTGTILDECRKACELLQALKITPYLYSFPTVKPIDAETIALLAQKCQHIFTVEEHTIVGGFGSAVAEVLAEQQGNRAQLHRLGLKDQFTSIVGSREYLREHYGLSASSIADAVRSALDIKE